MRPLSEKEIREGGTECVEAFGFTIGFFNSLTQH